MPFPRGEKSSFSSALRAWPLMRCRCEALPPVRQNPNPSMSWKVVCSLISIRVGFGVCLLNWRCPGCFSNLSDPLGFVSQTSTCACPERHKPEARLIKAKYLAAASCDLTGFYCLLSAELQSQIPARIELNRGPERNSHSEVRTSQASRRPSPIKFNASSVVTRNAPGNTMSHQ
jgi:hypothetical protein